jgi:L-serine dehydratase
MKPSLFDIYKIGIGPSSSHTMGPMRAARRFILELEHDGLLDQTTSVYADLYGSLALTGMGHGTDRAVLLGLTGAEAATIDLGSGPGSAEQTLKAIRETATLPLLGKRPVAFSESTNLRLHRDQMRPPGAMLQHPNGLTFSALNSAGAVLAQRTYFSIGGGFIVADGEDPAAPGDAAAAPLPYPFHNAAELLEMGESGGLAIWEMMLANESVLKTPEEVRAGILHLWEVMQECVAHGLDTEGTLPGGLNVRRRAPGLKRRLTNGKLNQKNEGSGDPLAPLDWVTAYAMAANEENAAGGRVVTAPTNGAAGVIPATLHYYRNFIAGADDEGIVRFFLTSAAIGLLYKENASISGAEVGCQGEVGVACSMAAGGLAAALHGSNQHVEHAAEIAMEHNLGMTCDPIGGLVQIPCIERNAMGAVKAVHACRIALSESGAHKVSLDQVIRTMYLTGIDMQSRYKETSLAGLALNIIEC